MNQSRKNNRRQKIKQRIRKSIFRNISVPRLSVYRSNKNIFAQIIDDKAHKTIISINSKIFEQETKITKSEKSDLVGKTLAEKAISLGVDKVVFDRNGYLYHGRIKRLADSARKAGLKF